METWVVKLLLECPDGQSPDEYTKEIRGFMEQGSVMPERDPGRRVIDVAVYATVEAPTAADSLVMTGDMLRAGLGVEEIGIRDAHTSRAQEQG